MAHVNIIARTNGVGLDRDVDLVHRCLTDAGHEVTVSHCRGISLFRAILPGKPQFDVNIFLERIFPRWFKVAKKNLIIPNQERFPERHIPRLKKIDTTLCKSRHAEDIFSTHGDTQYIGFTSKDMLDESVQKDYQSFLHLAGRSTLKGTETILKLWGQNPAWPTLTLIQCKENAPATVPDNVRLITDYVTDEELKKHLNTHGIHLCTSLSEGWGHYIVEAMSCRAVVVTTDAPPMNELITPARGVPVPYLKSEPRHLGTNFYIDPDKLEQNITRLLQMPVSDKERYGTAARDWFKKNDTHFNQSLSEALAQTI